MATPAPLPLSTDTGEGLTSSADVLPQLPPDPAGQSRVLTDYMKSHRLPLVGAHVVDSGDGRQVILYGFVATSQGKSNAEKRTRRIIDDPSVAIVNRIMVRPELLSPRQPPTSATASSGAAGVGANNGGLPELATEQSYMGVDQTQQYESQQQQSSWESLIIPLLMIGSMFIP